MFNSPDTTSPISSTHAWYRKASAIAAVAAALAGLSTSARATDFYFDIVNNTTQTITQVWVSPVSSGKWGAPFKGTFIPHSGGRQRVEFAYGDAYSTTCNYDVQVRFSGGHMTYWNNIDLCRTNGLDVDVVQGRMVGTTF
jgi:hypothetical protein